MNYFNWRERGGLGKIQKGNVAYYRLSNNYFEIQWSGISAGCFRSSWLYSGFCSFYTVKRIEHYTYWTLDGNAFPVVFDLFDFGSQVKTIYFNVCNQMLSRIRQSNVLQLTALFLSKLHAWINNLDARGMLSVNHFWKISSTFPTEKMWILSPRESLTPKTSAFKTKRLSSM